MTGTPGPARPRRHRAGPFIDHPYTLAVALAYDRPDRPDEPRHPRADGRLSASWAQLCERYGFAYYREWVLILDGWSRGDEPGVELARRGIGNLKAEGAFARMPYWLSLLADLSARNGEPGRAGRSLTPPWPPGSERDDLWWLPEVMRMRAAYDDGQAGATATARRRPDGVRPRQCRAPPALRERPGGAGAGAGGPGAAPFAGPAGPAAIGALGAAGRRARTLGRSPARLSPAGPRRASRTAGRRLRRPGCTRRSSRCAARRTRCRRRQSRARRGRRP